MKNGLHIVARNLRTFSTGFTLIETLVAITILVIAIAGPLTLASQGLFTALSASDQVTASYFAQDGIEFVHYIRDSNSLQGQPWLTNMDGVAAGTQCTSYFGQILSGSPIIFTCRFDSLIWDSENHVQFCSNSGKPCTGASQTLSYYNPNDPTSVTNCSGFTPPQPYTYNFSCGTKSKFSRTVSIQCPGSDTTCDSASEAFVTVLVQWQEGSIQHSLTLVDELYNWH